MATLISGGTVVNADGVRTADVVIEGERIAAVVDPSSEIAAAVRRGDHEIVDASGLLVVPGGVDPHVHLQLPMPHPGWVAVQRSPGWSSVCHPWTESSRAPALAALRRQRWPRLD